MSQVAAATELNGAESMIPGSNRETLLAAIIQFFKDNPGAE
jgi:hypothetical protein